MPSCIQPHPINVWVVVLAAFFAGVIAALVVGGIILILNPD